jgi:hypothetical protein
MTPNYLDYPVPFYANTPDGTHCFQAAFKMVLKYYWPDKNYSWEQLDSITAKKPDLWGWPGAGLCWLVEQGFTVKSIQLFDYERFVKEGHQYLRQTYGNEVADAQLKYSDFKNEISRGTQFLDEVPYEIRRPTIDEIKSYLELGFLVIANINSRVLAKKEGYVGHFVVIKGYDDEGLILHDPGLEPKQNIHTDLDVFSAAWGYPNEDTRNIIAISI